MLDMYKKYNGIVQYNSVIQDAFPKYEIYPSILVMPDINSRWELSLPNTDKDIVLHAQDYLNIAKNGTLPELLEIEKKYSQNVVIVHWNHNLKDIYNGTLKLVEFPTHSFEFVQDLKNRYKDWEYINNKTNTMNFMCLNGRVRPHRSLIYNYLKDMPNSVVTMFDQSNCDLPLYKDYDFDNADNFVKLSKVYQQCPVNVVVETMYYEPRGIISEKTLDAFAGLQLPILIGHRGIVANARQYGFDMFDDIIDHSYSDMLNDTRWKAAIDLNMHLLNGDFDYDALIPRLKKNQEYLLNGYLDLLVSNLLNQADVVLKGTS
jgi:hypothetical protein